MITRVHVLFFQDLVDYFQIQVNAIISLEIDNHTVLYVNGYFYAKLNTPCSRAMAIYVLGNDLGIANCNS
jgi:hypothetical protein